MSDKLEDLEKRLAVLRKAEETKKAKESAQDHNSESMNKGLQAGVELITSIIAGAFLGWALDKWLDTTPLFLIIFLLAGMGAGFLGIYKITNDIGSSMGFSPLHQEKKKGKNTPKDSQAD